MLPPFANHIEIAFTPDRWIDKDKTEQWAFNAMMKWLAHFESSAPMMVVNYHEVAAGCRGFAGLEFKEVRSQKVRWQMEL